MSDTIQKMIENEIARRVAEQLKAAPTEDPRLDQVRVICTAFIEAQQEALDKLMTDLAAVTNPGGKKKGGATVTASSASATGKPTDTDAAIVAALATGSKTFGELIEASYPGKPARGGVQIGTKNALARLTTAGKVVEVAEGLYALAAEGGASESAADADETAEETAEEMPTLQIPEDDEGEEVELEAN